MYSELQDEGFYPVEGNKWKRGTEFYLPLYQGRMIWQFDHRFNSIRVNPQGTHNPFLSVPVEEDEHADPSFSPQPQFWVPQQDVERLFSERIGYTLAFRDITNPTNERTMVATIVPWVGCSDTLAVLMPTDDSFSALDATCLLANLNSLCLDYVVRQKVQATHIKLYMIEQFPVVAPVDYDRQFGESTAREIVQEHVLKLTYTSHDMAPFARELGHHGPPIAWNEEERRHLRARLDALYFHLYGICRDDAAYILTTFPIVQRQDESTSGTYRTRNLILAYMNALSAGDTETVVDL